MSGHECTEDRDLVAVSISVQLADGGGGTARRWYTRRCCAEELAATLGEPHVEYLVTSEAAHQVAAAVNAAPGVVITTSGAS